MSGRALILNGELYLLFFILLVTPRQRLAVDNYVYLRLSCSFLIRRFGRRALCINVANDRHLTLLNLRRSVLRHLGVHQATYLASL